MLAGFWEKRLFIYDNLDWAISLPSLAATNTDDVDEHTWYSTAFPKVTTQ